MEKQDLTTDLLARAFALAWFIHRDRELALRIASEALARLEVAVAAQDKRLYYRPAGRTQPEGARRTRVSVSEQHLLQRLVYIISDGWERQSEQNAAAATGEEDMIVRFIKYLVQITVRRNSFYVTLGLSRLLHSYSTAETMDLYQVVVQDPERVRDDYYYRSRKAKLMQEMRERFGARLVVMRGARGEERFQTAECTEHQRELIYESLRMFTPWRTECPVPERIDRFDRDISKLAFNGTDADAEHVVEVSRFHAVLHPDCYRRLADNLNLEPPAARLAAPLFPMHRDQDQPPSSGRSRRAPDLASEEISAISRQLAEEAARRKYAGAGLLRILVDGREVARLDLQRTCEVSFTADEQAELIEVRTSAAAGDLLLATCLLTHHEGSGAQLRQAIVLEGGQKLVFTITPGRERSGDGQPTTIDLTWRETRLSRAAALLWRQRVAAVAGAWRGADGLRKPALILASLLLVTLSLWVGWQLRPPNQPQIVSQPTPAPEAVEPPVTPPAASPTAAPLPNRPRQVTETPLPEKQSQPSAPLPQLAERGRQPRPQRPAEPLVLPDESLTEETRGTRLATDERELVAVRKIHVDPFGSEPVATQLRAQLIAALRAQPRLTLSDSRNEADAVLKGRITITRNQQVTLTTRLVNAAGTVVWPVRGPLSGRQYHGTINAVAGQMVKDLLADIQKAERR